MDWRSALEELRRSRAPALRVFPDVVGDPSSVVLVPGSFDPITIAHVALAEAAQPRGGLVLFLYSVATLPKEDDGEPPLLGETDRMALVERVARGRGHAFALCSHGLLADQAEAARVLFRTSAIAFAVGSDKILQLLDPKWYEDRDKALRRLFANASEVLYGIRQGHAGAIERALAAPRNAEWRNAFRQLPIPDDVSAISSSEVRRMIRGGERVEQFVPSEIAAEVARAAES